MILYCPEETDGQTPLEVYNTTVLRAETVARLEASRIPEYMHGGIIRWLHEAIPPGNFLLAVINNDLADAAGRADQNNQHLLFDYVNFFYNYAPSSCWGSPEKVEKWASWRKS